LVDDLKKWTIRLASLLVEGEKNEEVDSRILHRSDVGERADREKVSAENKQIEGEKVELT